METQKEQKEIIKNIVLKHLSGQHNQKTHGNRGGKTGGTDDAQYYGTLNKLKKSGNQQGIDTFLFSEASSGKLPFKSAGKLSNHELRKVEMGYNEYLKKVPKASLSAKQALLGDFFSAAAEQKYGG